MEHNQWLELVNESITHTIDRTDLPQIQALALKIKSARRIFLMGSGRTGLITQAFGMRLAQLGLPAFIVDQPATPALEKDDFLVLISGSGKTESLLSAAKRADEIGAETYLVSGSDKSPLSELVSQQLLVSVPPQRTKVLNGTLFELSLLITLDAVVNQLLELTGQDYEDMSRRHANLG